MAAIPPYTSTYTDVDHSTMDATDLVAEFWRVAYFIDLWSGSIDAIGREDNFEVYIEIIRTMAAEQPRDDGDELRERGMAHHLRQAAAKADGPILALMGAGAEPGARSRRRRDDSPEADNA